MTLHEIEELESTLTREQLNEFNKLYIDLTYDIHGRRGYDSMFMYSQFSEMNTRTAVYLGYLIGLKKSENV